MPTILEQLETRFGKVLDFHIGNLHLPEPPPATAPRNMSSSAHKAQWETHNAIVAAEKQAARGKAVRAVLDPDMPISAGFPPKTVQPFLAAEYVERADEVLVEALKAAVEVRRFYVGLQLECCDSMAPVPSEILDPPSGLTAILAVTLEELGYTDVVVDEVAAEKEPPAEDPAPEVAEEVPTEEPVVEKPDLEAEKPVVGEVPVVDVSVAVLEDVLEAIAEEAPVTKEPVDEDLAPEAQPEASPAEEPAVGTPEDGKLVQEESMADAFGVAIGDLEVDAEVEKAAAADPVASDDLQDPSIHSVDPVPDDALIERSPEPAPEEPVAGEPEAPPVEDNWVSKLADIAEDAKAAKESASAEEAPVPAGDSLASEGRWMGWVNEDEPAGEDPAPLGNKGLYPQSYALWEMYERGETPRVMEVRYKAWVYPELESNGHLGSDMEKALVQIFSPDSQETKDWAVENLADFFNS